MSLADFPAERFLSRTLICVFRHSRGIFYVAETLMDCRRQFGLAPGSERLLRPPGTPVGWVMRTFPGGRAAPRVAFAA